MSQMPTAGGGRRSVIAAAQPRRRQEPGEDAGFEQQDVPLEAHEVLAALEIER